MTIQEIRAFNRFYTNLIGALNYSKHLYTPYTLTESRLLYELAHTPGTDAAELRAELSLDAGYLSRMLTKFEREGLVERGPSEHDARRQRVTLTPQGRGTAALLDERSRDAVGALLDRVDPDKRRRLVEALRTAREILSADETPAGTPGRPPVATDPCCAARSPAIWAGWCSGTARCTRRSTGGMPPSRAWSPGSSPTSRRTTTSGWSGCG